MQALRDRLGPCRTADEMGLRSDFVEAEAMAFLAARSLRGLPLTYPGTTGVAAPLTGGTLWRPEAIAAQYRTNTIPVLYKSRPVCLMRKSKQTAAGSEESSMTEWAATGFREVGK